MADEARLQWVDNKAVASMIGVGFYSMKYTYKRAWIVLGLSNLKSNSLSLALDAIVNLMLTFASNTVVVFCFFLLLLLFDTEWIYSNCTQQSQYIFESIVIKERIIHKLHSKHTLSAWMMLRFTAATVHYHFHSHSNHVRYYYLTRSNFVLCFNAENPKYETEWKKNAAAQNWILFTVCCRKKKCAHKIYTPTDLLTFV